ncbi:hypothetical protein J1N35_038872 [Gossypium stocksii]|uniref:Uncharacterized protein n=1 Tax=Gossypium stocksii TaxID=47602 RepID=A0A9D3UMN5_9ROSI|nr:hypothetical protein J1N35_038872 [Gossypium stocksii]
MFHHYLIYLNLNGWRPIDDNNGEDTMAVLPTDQESGTNHLMIIVDVDNRLVGNAGTIRVVEENSGESTSLPLEIDEYMDIRSFMKNVQGGPSVREFHRKKRKHRVETSGDVASTITVPPVVSSLPVYLLRERLPTEDTFGKFPYCPTEMGEQWRDSSLEEAKKHVCPSASSNCMRKPSLKELILSLQVALAEAGMVSVGLAEGIGEEEVKKIETKNAYQSTMGALERARKLHKQLDEEIKN